MPLSANAAGSKLIMINSIVAAVAGGTASFLNTFFMRRVEMKKGIEIYQDEALNQKITTENDIGVNVGVKSRECARKAIFETAWSRVFLSISCLVNPVIIFYIVEKAGKAPRNKLIKIPYETAVILFGLMVGLPASIALFPQTGSLKRSQLEKELRETLPENITTVYYNKGL